VSSSHFLGVKNPQKARQITEKGMFCSKCPFKKEKIAKFRQKTGFAAEGVPDSCLLAIHLRRFWKRVKELSVKLKSAYRCLPLWSMKELKKQNIVVGLRWWCMWLHNVAHIDWSFTFGECTKEWIGKISLTLLHLNNGQAEGMRTNPDS